MKTFVKTILAVISLFLFIHCNQTKANSPPKPQSNPVPSLDSLSPPGRVRHMPSFTLTANGSNFVSGSKIVFGGQEKQTTFVSASQLTCEVQTDEVSGPQLALAGVSGPSESAVDPVQVLIRNPSPGGGDSNTVQFPIWDLPTFTAPALLTQSTDQTFSPDIDVDTSDTIHVVWGQGPLQGNSDIFYSKSTDFGTSWTVPKNISNTQDPIGVPVVAADGSGNVYAAWEQFPLNSVSQIYFASSNNRGDTWNSPFNFSNTAFDSFEPDIGLGSPGHVNVVWENSPRVGAEEIYFSRSTDRGINWTLNKNISSSLVDSNDPSILVDSSGTIHVVWEEWMLGILPEIYHSRSSDNGQNWMLPLNISNVPEESYSPYIAVNNTDFLYTVWEQEIPASDRDLFASFSQDGGLSWLQYLAALVDTPSNAFEPALAIDQVNNHNLVWADGFFPSAEIFYCRSKNDGTDWGSFLILSVNQSLAIAPKIALDTSGYPYVVYMTTNPTGTEATAYFTGSIK